MTFSWGVGGAIIFGIFSCIGMKSIEGLLGGAVIGFVVGVAIRKWIFMNFWM